MIRATFDTPITATGDSPSGSRRISGVAVPYGIAGRVSDGTDVVFEPGSLDAAARPVALRDHDRARPIGRVVDATDRGDRLEATVRVSRTSDGDEALVLAADDVLGMFSVGVEPTDWHYAGDVLHVDAGDWQELSLLTIGAYPAARVATVTATKPEETNMITADPVVPFDVDEDDVPDEVEQSDDDEEETPTVETRVPALPINAAASRHPSTRSSPPLTLAALGPMIHAARAGHAGARRQLTAVLGRCTVEAALTDVTLVGTNNVAAMYRPAYQAEIIEIISHGSPIVDTISQGDLTNGDFPNKSYVKWDLSPQVATQTAEKADINTSPAKLSVVNVPVQTFATGNDISRQTLDLGAPSFVEEWVRAAAVDYAATIETYATTALMTAATAVTTLAGDSFIQLVSKLYANLNPANVPSGRLFLAVSHDMYASLIAVTQAAGPAFWGGSVNLGGYMQQDTTAGGLTVIDSPNLASKTLLMGLTNAATWYDAPGVPYTLQAVNVGKLGLDIGIYGYGACGVKFPAALVKTTQP